MKTLLTPILELSEGENVRKDLSQGRCPISVTGCIESQKCNFIYGVTAPFSQEEKTPPVVIVVQDALRAREVYEDYRLYDAEVLYYPAKDVIFYSADVHSNAIVQERMKVIRRLLEEKPVTVVMTIDGAMEELIPLENIRKNLLTVNTEDTLEPGAFAVKLVSLGYERVGQVEQPGQFSLRGGILDVFGLAEELPFRIELWGDEVDNIRSFDCESQRSVEQLSQIVIYPAAEMILEGERYEIGLGKIREEGEKQEKKLRKLEKTEAAERLHRHMEEFLENATYGAHEVSLDGFLPCFYETRVSFLDYFLNRDTVFVLDEPARLQEAGKSVEKEFQESMAQRLEQGEILPVQGKVLTSLRQVMRRFQTRKTLCLSTMESKAQGMEPESRYSCTAKSVNPYHNDISLLVKELKKYKKDRYRVLLLSASRSRGERLAEELCREEMQAFYTENRDREIQPGEVMVSYGQLRKGFEYPLIRFVVISDTDIFGAPARKKKRKRYAYGGKAIGSFGELSPGDYVVHESHGLGIYRGIEKMEIDYVIKDYIKIEYAGSGVLYIPATGLELLQKYSGAEGKKPKLNQLNSLEWKKTKAKVRGAVQNIAKELVELYAARQAKQGFAFGTDTVWQKEFEELFPYEETEDQLAAIEATKKDMESHRIMDRLICGDVGYGKTEIAIRAAFKAVSDGKQVAVLVPTTILAQQHYNTFRQRMKEYPITIEMLSRFRTPGQQKTIVEELKKGHVDIVIGTHRLLSQGVGYKDLGLLIVDEEQRFGVTHKEKIKKLKQDVDVLTLSATPIPRTLHMSLVGIRDMSVLEEPPVDRMPIQTFVLEHNESMIREAIRRELARGGQVYYVYNRVETIPEMAARVQNLVPEATVRYAHGKMTGTQLEQIMLEFINGEIDVLVSTTIVETGMDIANVNTMIIEDADRMGLSQLYQLRGRVGRSNRTAYAFLFYQRGKLLREVAEKRLQVIREFTDLGSGFKIALRDLEIRGAGNLLGASQHGHMDAVGYDLYCKMLNEAVQQEKGEPGEVRETFETTVDMEVSAFLPSDYIPIESQKLDFYKRIAEIETQEECEDLQDEMTDRFGEMPVCVNTLLRIALLKAEAHEAYMVSVSQKGTRISFGMLPEAPILPEKIPALLMTQKKKLRFLPETLTFVYELSEHKPENSQWVEDVFARMTNLIAQIQTLKKEKEHAEKK